MTSSLISLDLYHSLYRFFSPSCLNSLPIGLMKHVPSEDRMANIPSNKWAVRACWFGNSLSNYVHCFMTAANDHFTVSLSLGAPHGSVAGGCVRPPPDLALCSRVRPQRYWSLDLFWSRELRVKLGALRGALISTAGLAPYLSFPQKGAGY